jgi:hypothetical protein
MLTLTTAITGRADAWFIVIFRDILFSVHDVLSGAEAPFGLSQSRFHFCDQVKCIRMTTIDPCAIDLFLKKRAAFAVHQSAAGSVLVGHSVFCAVDANHFAS